MLGEPKDFSESAMRTRARCQQLMSASVCTRPQTVIISRSFMGIQTRKSKADQTVEGTYIILSNISKGSASIQQVLQIVAFGN